MVQGKLTRDGLVSAVGPGNFFSSFNPLSSPIERIRSFTILVPSVSGTVSSKQSVDARFSTTARSTLQD